MSIDIQVIGAKEYEEALKELEGDFKEETINFLDNKATELEKFIAEDIEKQGLEKSGKLKKSYKHNKPYRKGSSYEVKMDSKSKHSHLIEEGHRLIKYVPKKKDGGKAHNLGRVKGFYPVQNGIDRMNETYNDDIEKWMHNMINKKLNT
ncbi:HK97 gp10 family phage protein [Peptostreptococcus equinus]|uniref:HK97 gp10 family phage protein n=1 Tax=Peptostreptococcus equinus TaxID=3003601 RepID=A0ABY7JNK2_9FIRM|nr:HK97 gp10 family phage protein [Peptostreptococcus sp. CBA3647]WAW14749.1 hypothetical protein O0R46_09210 [Peptostreptococcus sp. CBA3647]